jgi:hypothetical protein
MCPGGQVVPTSIDPTELCVNGMRYEQLSYISQTLHVLVLVVMSFDGSRQSCKLQRCKQAVDRLVVPVMLEQLCIHIAASAERCTLLILYKLLVYCLLVFVHIGCILSCVGAASVSPREAVRGLTVL